MDRSSLPTAFPLGGWLWKVLLVSPSVQWLVGVAAALDPAGAALAFPDGGKDMGDDEAAGTAVRIGHGLRHPHDRREPCLLHIHPANSPHHHQPDKPALCRGPGYDWSVSPTQL